MTKSQTSLLHKPTPGEPGPAWRPLQPPRRGRESVAFHAYMLLPGFSIAFHAATLGCSRSSIAAYRKAAMQSAAGNPDISAAVTAALSAIRAEDGLHMSRMRGTAQLPYWSRLAVQEYRKRGFSRAVIAKAFCCSPGTVSNILQGKGSGYAPLSGQRVLTAAQKNPPGKIKASKVSGHSV